MFYSFVVFATREVVLPEHFVVLEPGTNTFNATVRNLQEFIEGLEAEGVRIIQKNCLDGQEPVNEVSLLNTLMSHDDAPQEFPSRGESGVLGQAQEENPLLLPSMGNPSDPSGRAVPSGSPDAGADRGTGDGADRRREDPGSN